MSIKNELILSYIKELDVGTKISVRRLSEILNVSVGTVYKAIKAAEAQGLVVTKPKSGTFKIDSGVIGEAEPVSLKRAAKFLGLTMIIEPADAERMLRRVVICDGSEKQLRRALSDEPKDNVNVLCLVGDRPDMQALVIELGANLMLTGGASAQPLTLIQAERCGLSVISALQDSRTIMMLLEKLHSPAIESTDDAQSWMKMPKYLYSNDVVADWHKLCEDIAIQTYPVVDENLMLCGALDVPKAFAANPSQRISGILRPENQCMHFDCETPMARVAEEMLLSGNSIAAVTDGDKLSGVLDSSDIMRYFMFSGRNGSAPMFESFLEATDVSDTEDEKYYNIRIPNRGVADPSEFTLPVVLTAAMRHAGEILGEGCVIESGTFFASKTIDAHESLMLSSKLTRRGEQGCTLEEEIFDDSCSYTKAILMFTAKQGE